MLPRRACERSEGVSSKRKGYATGLMPVVPGTHTGSVLRSIGCQSGILSEAVYWICDSKHN